VDKQLVIFRNNGRLEFLIIKDGTVTFTSFGYDHLADKKFEDVQAYLDECNISYKVLSIKKSSQPQKQTSLSASV